MMLNEADEDSEWRSFLKKGTVMNMTTENNVILALCVIGFCLLGFGFSNRDRNWGVAMMWVGVITMMGPIAYRLLTLF